MKKLFLAIGLVFLFTVQVNAVYAGYEDKRATIKEILNANKLYNFSSRIITWVDEMNDDQIRLLLNEDNEVDQSSVLAEFSKHLNGEDDAAPHTVQTEPQVWRIDSNVSDEPPKPGFTDEQKTMSFNGLKSDEVVDLTDQQIMPDNYSILAFVEKKIYNSEDYNYYINEMRTGLFLNPYQDWDSLLNKILLEKQRAESQGRMPKSVVDLLVPPQAKSVKKKKHLDFWRRQQEQQPEPESEIPNNVSVLDVSGGKRLQTLAELNDPKFRAKGVLPQSSKIPVQSLKNVEFRISGIVPAGEQPTARYILLPREISPNLVDFYPVSDNMTMGKPELLEVPYSVGVGNFVHIAADLPIELAKPLVYPTIRTELGVPRDHGLDINNGWPRYVRNYFMEEIAGRRIYPISVQELQMTVALHPKQPGSSPTPLYLFTASAGQPGQRTISVYKYPDRYGGEDWQTQRVVPNRDFSSIANNIPEEEAKKLPFDKQTLDKYVHEGGRYADLFKPQLSEQSEAIERGQHLGTDEAGAAVDGASPPTFNVPAVNQDTALLIEETLKVPVDQSPGGDRAGKGWYQRIWGRDLRKGNIQEAMLEDGEGL